MQDGTAGFSFSPPSHVHHEGSYMQDPLSPTAKHEGSHRATAHFFLAAAGAEMQADLPDWRDWRGSIPTEFGARANAQEQLKVTAYLRIFPTISKVRTPCACEI